MGVEWRGAQFPSQVEQLHHVHVRFLRREHLVLRSDHLPQPPWLVPRSRSSQALALLPSVWSQPWEEGRSLLSDSCVVVKIILTLRTRGVCGPHLRAAVLRSWVSTVKCRTAAGPAGQRGGRPGTSRKSAVHSEPAAAGLSPEFRSL